MAAALEAGVTRLFASAARTPSPRSRTAPPRSPRRQDRRARATGTSPRPRRRVAGDCAIDFYAGPTEIVIVAGSRAARMDRRRSRRAGRARSRRARDLHHLEPAVRRARGARVARQAAGRDVVQRSLAAHGAIDRHRARPTKRWRWPTASRPSTGRRSRVARAAAGRRRRSVRRPVHGAGRRRLRDRLESRAADLRRGAFSRRLERRRLRARHVGAARDRAGLAAARADDRAAGAGRRAARPRGIDRGPAERLPDKGHDERLREAAGAVRGLRLHQNENTGGCSPRVLEALAALRADQIGFLSAVHGGDATPARSIFGVDPDSLAADQRARRRHHGARRCAICGRRPAGRCPRPSSRAGVRDLRVRHRGRRRARRPGDAAGPTSSFALDEVLAAITPRTRVVFLTNPNNPTGRLDAARGDPDDRPPRAGRGGRVRRRGLRRVLRRDVHSRAAAFPNVIVGRTFSKAFGLAGLRIGCLVGAPDAARTGAARRSRSTASTSPPSSPSRRRSPIRDSCDDYLRQVRESKALLYAACERLGLRTGRATRTSCSSARASAPRRCVERRGGARHLHSRSLDRARLRGLRPHRDRHRRAHAAGASRSWKRCYAPRADRPTDDGDADRARLGLEGKGRYQRQHRHPVSRPHARALRAARRVRPARSRRPATSTSISITPSRISASRSARPCRRRSATGAASTAPATS